ncbi:flavodoxin family protein [Demequina sp. TTPB684]|uniref:flavodoxin family protein n=1 Tax=unclassified Demequina TaxID=2620311 RepID=UPI001CF1511D|nr:MULTISPECIES: flavodoxin family protein [unclassified Demequina]MCB2411738.1 flavodoxin family protein [Demequina sp. TTPB684]UPU87601.1 flavodoxin family protein [Demequina sp. TMPB413]
MTQQEFSDLKALFINCTLKPSPETSNTQGLLDVAAAVMANQGVTVDTFRAVDHDIAPGMAADMTEDVPGGNQPSDDWPALAERVLQADILVLGSPIWLGAESSVARRVIERLYAISSEPNERGQYQFYGRAGGAVVTGNEDGYKHVARELLYSLQHIGFTVPPQADTGWVGAAGPGPSYLSDDGGGQDNDFTQQTATFMAWNLMHTARWLKDSGGFPAGGNSSKAWSEGERFGHPAASSQG